MSLAAPRILNVGQCQADGPWMRHVLTRQLGAVVEEADTATEAVDMARQSRYQLILVNRELALDQTSGIDLVSDLIAVSPQTPVMLVSDFEDAQASAVQLGASPGFGKQTFGNPETLSYLKKTVDSAPRG